jgi:hypothetical protein
MSRVSIVVPDRWQPATSTAPGNASILASSGAVRERKSRAKRFQPDRRE